MMKRIFSIAIIVGVFLLLCLNRKASAHSIRYDSLYFQHSELEANDGKWGVLIFKGLFNVSGVGIFCFFCFSRK